MKMHVYKPAEDYRFILLASGRNKFAAPDSLSNTFLLSITPDYFYTKKTQFVNLHNMSAF